MRASRKGCLSRSLVLLTGSAWWETTPCKLPLVTKVGETGLACSETAGRLAGQPAIPVPEVQRFAYFLQPQFQHQVYHLCRLSGVIQSLEGSLMRVEEFYVDIELHGSLIGPPDPSSLPVAHLHSV